MSIHNTQNELMVAFMVQLKLYNLFACTSPSISIIYKLACECGAVCACVCSREQERERAMNNVSPEHVHEHEHEQINETMHNAHRVFDITIHIIHFA